MSDPEPERAHDASVERQPTTVRTPQRRSLVELSVGLAALVVSVASLFVARHQAQVMDRQLAASVWPLLEYASSDIAPDGGRRAALHLRNTGIGPLRIRSFRATYDGRPATGPSDLIERCCARDTADLRRMRIVSSYVGGRVMSAGESFDMIDVQYDSATATAFADLRAALRKLQARYCYCSVLDDCWIRDSGHEADDPTPVGSCDDERRQPQFVL